MTSKSWIAAALVGLAAALPLPVHPAGGKPEGREAWVRASIPGQDVTAAYLVLDNRHHGADWLVEASCACAKAVEIHRMVHASDRMKMERVERLALPARGTVELKPGGLHLMLFGLARPLRPGETIRLRLRFAVAGQIEVQAAVRAVEGGADAGH